MNSVRHKSQQRELGAGLDEMKSEVNTQNPGPQGWLVPSPFCSVEQFQFITLYTDGHNHSCQDSLEKQNPQDMQCACQEQDHYEGTGSFE